MIKVRRAISKKGNEYLVLINEVLGKEYFVSFDQLLIAKISGLSFTELYALKEDYIIMRGGK